MEVGQIIAISYDEPEREPGLSPTETRARFHPTSSDAIARTVSGAQPSTLLSTMT
jgi:hypothetical protein